VSYWTDSYRSGALVTEEEVALAVATAQRLLSGSGVGSIVPPRLAAGTNVPLVSGLRVFTSSGLNGQTLATLCWYEPSGYEIATYNVYVRRAIGANQAPQLVASSVSPARFAFQADDVNECVFIVQTVMRNGQTSAVELSPTCTVTSADTAIEIADGSVTLAKLASGLTAVQIVAVLPAFDSLLYPAGTVLFVEADDKLYRSTGADWTLDVDGADIVAGSIIAGKLSSGAVSAGNILAAAIDATKLNILQVIVVGMTLTDNSPGAGRVAWSACTVYYDGTAYSISSGSTASSAERHIYWTVGGTSFTSAASFSPGPTIFPIATSDSGTSDIAWNKLPKKGIQEDNLGFSLLTGQQVQPLVTTTISDAVIPVGVGTQTHSTTLLSTTGDGTHIGGGLLTVTARVVTVRTWNPGLFVVAPKLELELEVDGQTPQRITIFDQNSDTYPTGATDIALRIEGVGSTIGDAVVFQINIGFTASLVAKAILTGTQASSGGGAGQTAISLLYCTKTT
jgi:hypothetical protein